MISLELSFSPMGFFAIGIKHPLDMTVERLHDPDTRHHRHLIKVEGRGVFLAVKADPQAVANVADDLKLRDLV